MKRFRIEITSEPDRKNLVAEIWFGENLVAEVNHESEYLEIELYPSEKLKFRFKNFQYALEEAKSKLKEYISSNLDFLSMSNK